jgi:hypothetical protein
VLGGLLGLGLQQQRALEANAVLEVISHLHETAVLEQQRITCCNQCASCGLVEMCNDVHF